MGDSLDDLVVDHSAIARGDLARALQPFVRFTGEGQLWLEAGFDDLPADQRVLCVLLAVQGLHILGYRDTDQVTPAEVVELSGMASGTVRPKLSALLKQRRIAKNGARYSLPIHSARRAVDLLVSAHG